MSNVIQSYFTRSLCSTCYREVPAQVEYRTDGSAYIVKECPKHGHEEHMVERSWQFWEDAFQPDPNNITRNSYNRTYIIESTDRCNLMCKHCYHLPDNAIEDKPKEYILSKIRSAPMQTICLMGAEPTMREDLFEIIEEIRNDKHPKRVQIYTNGLKLALPDYVKRLDGSGLDGINISVHNPKYHKDRLWQNISRGVDYIVDSNISMGQISFTVESFAETEYAVEKILWFKENNRLPYNFCIRSGADIGTALENGEIFASEIAGWVAQICQQKNISFEKHPNGGSNPYHVLHTIDDDILVQIIHWGSVKNVDLKWMNMGPFAEFVPCTMGTLHLQIILREGWKKGWWQGQRLIDVN